MTTVSPIIAKLLGCCNSGVDVWCEQYAPGGGQVTLSTVAANAMRGCEPILKFYRYTGDVIYTDRTESWVDGERV